MKKLFVTTDLSGNSKAGILFAIQFAKQLNAELIFCHIAELTKPTSWSAEHYKRFEKETIESKTALLKSFVNKTAGKTKLTVNAEYLVRLSFNVDSMIISLAKKSKADFICMSTRGAGKVKKLFGTNASVILTTSTVPVVVVPKNYKTEKIKQLFFAGDFFNLKREMKEVQTLTDALKCELKLVHYDYMLHVPEIALKLEKKSELFKSKNTSFLFKRMDVGRTLTEHLNEDIMKEKPSMVILFTKQNRRWFDKLILPSEAEEMSFNAKIPLLTFKKKLK